MSSCRRTHGFRILDGDWRKSCSSASTTDWSADHGTLFGSEQALGGTDPDCEWIRPARARRSSSRRYIQTSVRRDPLFKTISRELPSSIITSWTWLSRKPADVDAHELPFAQVLNCSASAIAHACSQAAYELIHQVGQHPFIRHADLNTFRNQLPAPCPLEHSDPKSGAMGTHRPHAAIALEGPALIENRFAGLSSVPASRLPIITQSHRRDGLGDIAGNLMPPSAISGTPLPCRRLGALRDRGNRGHPRR